MMIIKKVKCHPPQTPNYIRPVDMTEQPISIHDLSDKQIRELGREWVAELMAKREARRNEPHGEGETT